MIHLNIKMKNIKTSYSSVLNMDKIKKNYEPLSIEEYWYSFWEKNNYFYPTGIGEPYCIMLPPPNITGTLHMGHAFQDTIMDALIRYHRMKHYNVLWQPGTDHAGIATQIVVERQYSSESKESLGREKFLNLVWQWKAKSGKNISSQLRRIGSSLDWSRERFTLDNGLSIAVREAFVRLYKEGLIYRGKKLVNWDPVLRTAVSDLEVISSEEDSFMWYIRYPLVDQIGNIIVATTRPETIFGDMAVAIHPDDQRYKHLAGLYVKLPLSTRKIPIITDSYVDPNFGSGCVKITPGHDFNDYIIGQRHNLPILNIFNTDASINENCPFKYRGLSRTEARKLVIETLESQELIEDVIKYKLIVPRSERSNSVIEPLLTNQWYVKTKPLAEQAISAVANGKIKFIPSVWEKTYFDWLHRIDDWCISRQIWWGHRIPAWYDNSGNIYVGHSEEIIRNQYKIEEEIALVQDPDVLDTWFSSSIWPFSTLGWPKQTLDLKTFYPTSVLVTGFDIIFFWVARMVMMGLKFMGDVPFREVYIHGLVRDHNGQKMSKSRGNVLDPLDLVNGISLDELIIKRTTGLIRIQDAPQIKKDTLKYFPNGIRAYGADALRLTFAALATTGRDIIFDIGRIEGYRNFCNKLWHAARYVINSCEQDKNIDFCEFNKLSIADKWILSQLQHTISDTEFAFKNYRFDHVTKICYEFTWKEFCDWYLELAKINNSAGTKWTLIYVLEVILRLLHPIIPFITEEIWQKTAPLVGKTGTIMLQPYPQINNKYIDQFAVADIEWLKNLLTELRRVRSTMNINPGQLLEIFIQGSYTDYSRLEQQEQVIMILGKISKIVWAKALPNDFNQAQSYTILVNSMKIFIYGVMKNNEADHLIKEIKTLRKLMHYINTKLDNPKFIEYAPIQIVEKERQRLADIQSKLANLEDRLLHV